MRKIYKIGDNFCNNNRNYTITNCKKIQYQCGNKKKYQYVCNICGYDCSGGYRNGKFVDSVWFDSSQFSRGDRCSCCSNKIVVPNINSIFATRKDLIPFFKDINDSKKYCENSNAEIILKCPDCGTEKKMLIPNFIKRGFTCPKCSDKISIGEKIVYCVLDSLKIDFVKELSEGFFPWCQRYRYDFYIKDSNTIVEVNGKQHYEGNGFSSYTGGKTVDEEIKNDNTKFNLALNNGITNYIIIDASMSDFNYIKQSILLSDLSKMYDLSNINWDEILELTTKSLIKEVCIMWNKSKSISLNEMTNIFHLNNKTISKYLKIGNEIGWCKFNDIISRTSHYDNPYIDDAPNYSKPIICLYNNIYFKSIGLCSKNSKEIFGRYIGDSTIRHLLKHTNGKFKKVVYDFEYITKEEFNNAVRNGSKCYGKEFVLD